MIPKTTTLLSGRFLKIPLPSNPYPNMNNNKSILTTTKILYNYHMSYLMDSKYDDRFVKIDRRAFHLYRDSILNFPQQAFNQKIYLTVLIDTVRTKQSYSDFEKLVDYGIQHIDQFKQPLSIFNFASQLYLYNYPKKEQSYKLAKKGFEFFRQNSTMKFSSYYVMKFLIFLQKNVGLGKFADQDYKMINFTRFKPLFLCFTLEMFYENKLDHYSTIQHVFELFVSSESIIPFADIHHYKMTVKKIHDPRFKEFVDNLSKRIMDTKQAESQQDSINDVKQGIGGMVDEDGDKIEEDVSHNEKQSHKTFSKINNLSRQQSFPWQKAYQSHVYRQFTYYPVITNQSTNEARHHHHNDSLNKKTN